MAKQRQYMSLLLIPYSVNSERQLSRLEKAQITLNLTFKPSLLCNYLQIIQFPF